MSTNHKELILQRLGPCGLHCGKCFAFSEGEIASHSQKLKAAMGNFNVYAERFADMLADPIFLTYPAFKEFLDYLSTVECKGCRKEQCKLFKTCNVRPCSQEKGIDFCFACEEFPCDKTGFDEHLYKRHIEINQRMKKIGVENYYEEIKDQSRY